MKVKELKSLLEEFDDGDEVVLQKDLEGNGHAPLAGAWDGAWDDENGEVGIRKLTVDDVQMGYTEDDVLEGVPAAILVPTR